MNLALRNALKSTEDDPDELRRETISTLMAGYDQQWGPTQANKWTTTEVEKTFVIKLVNPDTGKPSRTFRHAGKIDALARMNDDLFLIEHKTCGDTIDEPGAPYWKRLQLDTQINGYMLAGAVGGVELAGCLYDVIRKPEIRPKKLSMKDVTQLNISLEYLGEPVDAEDVRQVKEDPDNRETPRLYSIRLLKDIASRPGWYFQRKLIYLAADDVVSYARELWLDSEDVRIARTRNDTRRNSGACVAFGRACEYLELCTSSNNNGLIQIGNLHPELNVETSNGQALLTNSRINTFRQCRRKHYYRYELGLAPQEPAEALTFGDRTHKCLAEWWNTYRASADDFVSQPDRNGQAVGA